MNEMTTPEYLVAPQAAFPQGSPCEENSRLLNTFTEAVTELALLHEQQFMAVVAGDPDFQQFDELVREATERRQEAKFAYLHHVSIHGC